MTARHKRTTPLNRVIRLVLGGSLAALTAVIGGSGSSSATFVQITHNSATVAAAEDWTAPTVQVTPPAGWVRGTTTVSVTASDDRSGIGTVDLQQRIVGGSAWQSICITTTAPYACTWNTSSLANGSSYDLRAVATDRAGNPTTSTSVRAGIDNAPPTVTMTDPPGTTLRGTITLSATVADLHSGVASVTYQTATSAAGPFQTACTATAAPFSCAFDTTSVPAGQRYLRAVATDLAGNATTSAVIGPRLIDNSSRSITLTDPGSFLEGTVSLTSTTTSTAAITSVRYQRAPAGGGTWTDVCIVTTTPWACTWNTRQTADGTYDLRAVLTDINGAQAVSNVISSRTVDNTTTSLRGVDIQTTNGGDTVGRVEPGDAVVYTFSRRVDLNTIAAGWDGSALDVRLEIQAGLLTDDVVITKPSATIRLGSVQTYTKFIPLLRPQTVFYATMTAVTETVNGIPRTVVTVTAGPINSGEVRTIELPTTLTWKPPTGITGLSGQTLSTATVTESGQLDKDF